MSQSHSSNGSGKQHVYVYNPNPPPLPFIRYVIAGAFAGIAEILCMYPLDVVKTRLQLQHANSTGIRYNGVLDCFGKIVSREGFLTLYRGILAPICAEAPKRAVKFSTNEFYKNLFKNLGLPNNEIKMFASGLFAGITESFINCPFEVIKVRMQAQGSVHRNTVAAVYSVVRNEGIRAVFKGLSPQIFRNAIWNSLYFSQIFTFKTRLFPEPKSEGQELRRNFIAGVASSLIATTLATPFDCVKSRMQSVRVGEVSKWKTVFGSLRTIYREEGGYRACFKGLAPRLLRLGPGGGIMLVAFDFVSTLLS